MATTAEPLKAPFPYPGGKSRVADLVWSRLGNVQNYIEPFMGSAAVLLRRPAEHFAGGYRVETANDANHFVANFWRAVTAAPEDVARYADRPVTEADLHASHRWLVRSTEAEEWRRKMASDFRHYDAEIAGAWVHGACCWIGSGWCDDAKEAGERRPVVNGDGQGYGVIRGEPAAQIVDLSGGFGRGVGVRSLSAKMPEVSSGLGRGVAAAHGSLQVPHMDGAGRGGHRGRPQLTDAFDIGRGVNSGAGLASKVPLLSGPGDGVNAIPGAGTCDARRAWLVAWMRRLSDRLRLVRTCYGHWARVCDSDSTLTRLGTTGVFLDPPYPLRTDKGTRAKGLYANDSQDLNALRDEVLAWCRKWGQSPDIRVAVCGYEGDGYEPLVSEGWDEHAWSASGGYGNQRKKGGGKAANADRERIWFSPACLRLDASASLFDCLPA